MSLPDRENLDLLLFGMIRQGCSLSHAIKYLLETPNNGVNTYSLAKEISEAAMTRAENYVRELKLCEGIIEIFKRRERINQPLETTITYVAGYLEAFLVMYPCMDEVIQKHLKRLNEAKSELKKVKKDPCGVQSRRIGESYLNTLDLYMVAGRSFSTYMHHDLDLIVSTPSEPTGDYVAYVRKMLAAQLYLSRKQSAGVCAEIAGCSMQEFFQLMEESDLTVKDYLSIHGGDPDFSETVKDYIRALPMTLETFDEMLDAVTLWNYDFLHGELHRRFFALRDEMDIGEAVVRYERIMPDDLFET